MLDIATFSKNLQSLAKALGLLDTAGMDPGFTSRITDDPKYRAALVEFDERWCNRNPFEQTVEQQLAALRKQNELGGWGIGEDVFARLKETAPAWPEGKHAYRSLRIRFGEGRDGVIKTFEAHAAAIKRVHAKHWRWELLLSGAHLYQDKDVERLRLLAGNDTHHAVIEWIIIPDLEQYRQRTDITSVRGVQSFADEGVVFTWLFPGRIDAIDYNEWCAIFFAGYESNVPGHGGEPWRYVPCVSRCVQTGEVRLSARWRSHADSGYSVPSFGE